MDRGAADGLQPGVELRCEGECGGPHVYQTALVVDAGAQATAEATVFGQCDELDLPRPGWEMETGAYRPGG